MKNFIKYPSKRVVIGFTTLWCIGFILQVLAATDLFTKSPLDSRYFMVGVMLLASTILVVLLHINYWKTKSIKNDK